jgi:RNA polymerase sigma-70 factor (ECF subfamily)
MATMRSDDPARAAAPQTLGDLLYRDRVNPPVSEKEWVELVRGIAAGDQQALYSLFTRTHRIVFTLVIRITGDRSAADEVTIDVFHDVWRRAEAYDPAGGSVIGWILNQARSRAIDRVRFEHRKKRAWDPRAIESSGDAVGPREALAAREHARRVREAVQQLSPDERQAIETAFFRELTYRETAAELKQPEGTVKARIRSALMKLRQALAPTSDET